MRAFVVAFLLPSMITASIVLGLTNGFDWVARAKTSTTDLHIFAPILVNDKQFLLIRSLSTGLITFDKENQTLSYLIFGDSRTIQFPVTWKFDEDLKACKWLRIRCKTSQFGGGR